MLKEIKSEYYKELDELALNIAEKLIDGKLVTQDILNGIKQIYEGTSLKRLNGKNFRSSYHSSATPDSEFFISRILFNYSKLKGLDWKILLRVPSKPKDKTLSPDLRIEKENKTIAIIEIKLKVGFVQGLFSDKRAEYDIKRKEEGKATFDVVIFRKKERERVSQLSEGFGIVKDKIFYLVPSLKEVHRTEYDNTGINDYRDTFTNNLDIPKENLILLSSSLKLNLDTENLKEENFSPTGEFEKFIKKLD